MSPPRSIKRRKSLKAVEPTFASVSLSDVLGPWLLNHKWMNFVSVWKPMLWDVICKSTFWILLSGLLKQLTCVCGSNSNRLQIGVPCKTTLSLSPVTLLPALSVTWWFGGSMEQEYFKLILFWNIPGCLTILSYNLDKYSTYVIGLKLFTSLSRLKSQTSCGPMAPESLPFPWLKKKKNTKKTKQNKKLVGAIKFSFMIRSLMAQSKIKWDKQY